MAENEYRTNEQDANVERSSEDIRQDIAHGEETLAQTVDEIGARIKEKLDWREYVRDSPYLAIGAAAGLGYLAARMFRTRRARPLEHIVDSLGGHARDALGGLIVGAAGPSLIKGALLGIATKAAAGWIEHAIATAGSGDASPRPQTGRDATIDPSTET